MEQLASIDLVSRTLIEGWVVSKEDVTLKVNGEHICKVTEFYRRQDLVDSGITEEDIAFSIDVSSFLMEVEPEVTVELYQRDNKLVEKSTRLKSIKNLISNPFFKLSSFDEIEHWTIKTNHRVGISLNSFYAPAGLKYSNGFYTRINLADANITKSPVDIIPPEFVIPTDFTGLQIAIVAKASRPVSLHVRVLSKDGRTVWDFPVMLSHSWQEQYIDIDPVAFEQLKNDEASIKLCTKHYGRSFIDLAMVYLAEDAQHIKIDKETSDISTPVKGNLIKNGTLDSWSNGINFKSVTRGQELADNWYIEFDKANKDKVAVAAISDSWQKDSCSVALEPSFGLRVKTQRLSGYNRIVIPFAKADLDCVNHELTIDVAPIASRANLILPRIYMIARDAFNDLIVHDVVRKQALLERTTLKFKLSPQSVEHIINRATEHSVICIAIDIPSNFDIGIYSVTLETVSEEPAESIESSQKSENLPIHFEDQSICEQLTLLKGLESWLASSAVTFEKGAESPDYEKAKTVEDFKQEVALLTRHKMSRPSRTFPTIDVIVPVYNACDDVYRCISALVEKTDILHRVIIINDGDELRTENMLTAFNESFSHIEVIKNPENLGYTKSVNKGITHSNSDWVVVLNSDTIVSEGWLGKLLNCALSGDKVGMVGALSNAASWQSVPRIHDKSGDWHLNPLPEGMTVDDMAELVTKYSERSYPEVGVINGFCQLISMNMLDEIGLLDEIAFPVGYGEENDMCARAVKAGYKLIIADDTYIFHAKSKSFGHEKRKVLAKQGSAALKKKHPDVDWGKVTKLIFENENLVKLREQLAEHLIKD